MCRLPPTLWDTGFLPGLKAGASSGDPGDLKAEYLQGGRN
jgi:hypothetical protein